LMLMFLNKGQYNGKRILRPETIEEIFKRSMVSAIDFTHLPPISDKTGFYYGLGVGSYDYAGHQIIEKGGALAGVRTIIVLVPDKNAGIRHSREPQSHRVSRSGVRVFFESTVGHGSGSGSETNPCAKRAIEKTDGAPAAAKESRQIQRLAAVARRRL